LPEDEEFSKKYFDNKYPPIKEMLIKNPDPKVPKGKKKKKKK